jgi:hypothetical protein
MENTYTKKYVDEYIKTHPDVTTGQINNITNIFASIIWKFKNKFVLSTVLNDIEILVNKSKLSKSMENPSVTKKIYELLHEKIKDRSELFNKYLERSFENVVNNIKCLDMKLVFDINLLTDYFGSEIEREHVKELEKLIE